eukprot:jgi/Astpho2/5372/fgenesh1_pg.00075_%23_44_t
MVRHLPLSPCVAAPTCSTFFLCCRYQLPAPWYQLAVMPFAIGAAGAACFWAIGDRLPPETKALSCAAGTLGTVLVARAVHLFWTTGKEAEGKTEKVRTDIMMQLTANQTAAFRPQTVSRKAAGARLVVRAYQAGPVFELADIGKTGGENPVPLVNEATGNKEGATRDNIPGLGDIKGPRPKSEAFSGSNSVDVPSIPNPFAKADEAKDAAKRTVAKNNPLSYINVLGDLAVQEGRKPGQDDPFGGLTGQQGEAKILPSKNAKTQGLKVPAETQKQAEKQKWEVVESGAGTPRLYGASLPVNMTGPQLLREVMDLAVSNNLTVMRIWAQSVDSLAALQISPGVYKEEMFRGLDYALDQASQRNIKVIASFIDNWQYNNGLQQYANWAVGPAATPLDFYTNPTAQGYYRDHVKTVINRVNTINGRPYVDDPTIFAWDLINEPHCIGCPNGTIATWVNMMAPYVKSLDKNHLLTLGEEGFYSTTANRLDCNPLFDSNGYNITWPQQTGQDFIADHASSAIDFAAFHSWVILEEYGKWINETTNSTMAQRNEYYAAIVNQAESLMRAANNSNLRGTGFWEWYLEDQVGPVDEGGGRGLYGVSLSDETFNYIRQNADFEASLSQTVPGCDPSSHQATLPATKNCSSTEINGLPGTGLEGPDCTININECLRGTDNCAPNAACIDTNGSFACECWLGYTGDGIRSCTPTAALQALPESYTSEATQGPLLCDIAYPMDAPGYAHDPTANPADAGIGSVSPVTSVQQCMIACETAPGCTNIAFSPDSQLCFLKGCPGNYAVRCPFPAPSPPPGQPMQAPPAPPAPPSPPCSLNPVSLCPVPNATYYSFFSKVREGAVKARKTMDRPQDRYQPSCTFPRNDPGISLAPASDPAYAVASFPPGTNETAAQMYGVAPSSLGPQETDIKQEGTDTTLPTSLTAERKANAERHPAPPVEEEAPAAGNSTGSNTTAAGNATAGPPASAADLTGLNDIATTIGSNAAAG